MSERTRRKTRVGVVVSDRRERTISVQVATSYKHPRYHKVVRKSKLYHVHDQENDARLGDTVRIVETRPISKQKRWRMTEILERAK
ncbi:MAG: 30S ribosomal protein S17 [bacterium]|nr:30S ribosomal protein S17 [Acidimicrobiia bacterium]MCY4651385.1 30S ribosomal protein S17 [bacterium]